MKFCNAVFVVTESCSCPFYPVGEEFIMDDFSMIAGGCTDVCLILMHELLKVLADASPPLEAELACGGCATGSIRFKRKQDMECGCALCSPPLLPDSEQHGSELFSSLREMELFKPLCDFELHELTLLMEVRQYPPDTVITEAGERGSCCYVVLSGQAVTAAAKDSRAAAEIGPGGVFGEMCLLSGEAVSPSVRSLTELRLAVLQASGFARLLSRCPSLQIFFYRVLARRSTRKEDFMQAGELTDYITLLDLLQIINTGGKTGRIELTLPEGSACVLFHEGEIIHASFGPLLGREALFALLAQQHGSFVYSKGLTAAEKELPILGGFVGLLMEGLQRLDEQGSETDILKTAWLHKEWDALFDSL